MIPDLSPGLGMPGTSGSGTLEGVCLIARRGRFDGGCGGMESDAGGHPGGLEGSAVCRLPDQSGCGGQSPAFGWVITRPVRPGLVALISEEPGWTNEKCWRRGKIRRARSVVVRSEVVGCRIVAEIRKPSASPSTGRWRRSSPTPKLFSRRAKHASLRHAARCALENSRRSCAMRIRS